jgi:D-mannonate dehydratase
MAEHPHAQAEVGKAVEEAASRIADAHIVAAAGSDLHASLEAMHRSGQLDDEQIRCFAEDGLTEQVKLALALISRQSLEFIAQALMQDSGETLIVLARANGLAWSTVKTMLQLPGGKRARTPSEIRQCLARFEKLNRATACDIMQFYKARGAG